jgi:hypothetical protein
MLEMDTQLLILVIAGWITMLLLIILAIRKNPREFKKILRGAIRKATDVEKEDRRRNQKTMLSHGLFTIMTYIGSAITLTELIKAYQNIDRNFLLISAACGWLLIIILVVLAMNARGKIFKPSGRITHLR